VKAIFNSMPAANKLILTTEKDAMRLKNTDFSTILKDLPVFYIPIEITFDEKDKNALNNSILNYVRTHQRNSSLHSK
jgi:tetraacyldisaccharide 4'-kinase